MYSSLDKPTHEDWVNESNELLEKLEYHRNYYTEKIRKYQEEHNDAMVRYYCLKLKRAVKELEIGEVALSNID